MGKGGKTVSTANRSGGRGRGIACASCGDPAKTLRKGRPSCKACFRLSPEKWAEALVEMATIERRNP